MVQRPSQSGSPPDFSVIVPCYNHGNYLTEALESIRRQDHEAWECIIVDDGSHDNTPAVAKQFATLDARFQYLRQPNSGVSVARNYGITSSKGRYILPLDADDRISPHYLTAACAVLDKFPSVAIVYCHAEKFGSECGPWQLPRFDLTNILLENCIFSTAAFRRIDFDKVGGFRVSMRHGYEDWDFWLSLLSRGGDVFQLPETYFYYRIRAGSRNRSMSEEQYREMQGAIYAQHVSLYLKHFGGPIDNLRDLRRLQMQTSSCSETLFMFLRCLSRAARSRAALLRSRFRFGVR